MADKTITQGRHLVRPHSSVIETADGKLMVVMEVPGVARKDLEIKIENNELNILARRTPLNGTYILRERHPGDYTQTFMLDETVDRSKVDAKLANGVLTVTLELKEQVKPRTIKIRAE